MAARHCFVALVERGVVIDGLVCVLKFIFDVLPRVFGLVVNDYINGCHV